MLPEWWDFLRLMGKGKGLTQDLICLPCPIYHLLLTPEDTPELASGTHSQMQLPPQESLPASALQAVHLSVT